jgi:chromosome segregation ATPase
MIISDLAGDSWLFHERTITIKTTGGCDARMFVKRMTINGFKSFAHRTVLELEPGMTAVVGPNGSGKSNIADAVRWVLGEQSGKSLRAKKGEDVIFAGTAKKPRGSAAEVTLVFDNSDGRVPVEFAEIQISRKLYRSGESEYRLGGRKVRLLDLEQLLAQAGFGTQSYSVVSQGMVDSLILASAAERKVMFDEASGIKEFELKRERALRRLEQTQQNTMRIRDILTEIEPRLATLARAAKAAETRGHLQADVTAAREVYLVTARDVMSTERAQAEREAREAQAELKAWGQKLAGLEREQAHLQATQQGQASERQRLTVTIGEREVERDRVADELSVKRAEQQFAEERMEQLRALAATRTALASDLKAQQRVRQQLAKQLAEAQVGEQEHAEKLAAIGKQVEVAQRALSNLRRQVDETTGQEYVAHALSILKQVSYALAADTMKPEEIRLLVYKAGRLLGLASKSGVNAVDRIREAQRLLTALMREREKAHTPYTQAVIKLRSVELDSAHNEEEISRLEDQLSALGKQLMQDKTSFATRDKEITSLKSQLERLDAQLHELREASARQTPDDSEAVFQLAERLQAARLAVSQNQARQQEAATKLADLDRTASDTERKHQEWLGGKQLSGTVSTRPLAELEREIYILEDRLRETQATDAAALEEYTETKNRYEFLTAQLLDLESAAVDYGKVAAQLEKQIKSTFERNIAAISKAFGSYFRTLFAGGEAELQLETTETGYGVEIIAVPPGKRVKTLATLSGGERALTGTALLAAILSVSPSPFVVLDEVDAALDEANSGRLAQILAELATHSQLIVVTHNRQIMAAADRLYGVTTDAHHASTLLSVKFAAASEMAAR